MKTILLTVSLVVSLLAVCPAQAQIGITSLTATKPNRRVALVIGNNDYQYLTPLKNSLNDASAMTQALKSLQFEVTTLTNVTYPQFMDGFAAFSEKLRSADVALVYFSVHAGNYKGHYYLLPIDAKADCDLAMSSIDLRSILSKLNEHPIPNSFVLLDAGNGIIQLNQCANVTNHSIPPIIPKGSMLVYAGEPGNQATEDIAGQTSVFTSELVKHLTTPDLDIRTIMDRTAMGVQKRTSGKQAPVRYDRLTSDFKFSRPTTHADSTSTKNNVSFPRSSGGISALPLQTDLSPFVPPVIDQKHAATCVPWATAYYAYTTQYGALHNITDTTRLKQISLSPMLPYRQLRSNSTKGLNLDEVAQYIKDNGDVTYEEYPNGSDTSTPSAELLEKAQKNRPIKDILKILDKTNTSREKIFFTQQQLSEYKRPVIAGIQVTNQFIKLTGANRYYQPSGNYTGLQAVTVVGYDRTSFLMVNSWGKNWGGKGYFRMKFDDFAKVALGGLVLVLPDEQSPTAQKK